MSSQKEQKIGVGVGLVVVRDNKVLLGKRHPDPFKAGSALHGEGTWTMPGGKLEFGESFEEGCCRELKEETGMDAYNIEVICVNNDMVKDTHFVTIGLLVTEFSGEPQVCEPDEITQWNWFSFEDIPDPLFFPSARILECYQDSVFYKSN